MFISSVVLLISSAICCHFCEIPLPFNPLLRSLQRMISSSAVLQVFLFLLVVLAVDELSLVSEQLAGE